MDAQNSRMILVSNRLPITIGKAKNGNLEFCRSTGGLVSGLREIHDVNNSLWLGHSGIFSDDSSYPLLKEKLRDERLFSVDLLAAEYQHYYNGFCNNIIWPLFHYFPEYICPEDEGWPSYLAVNQRFADAVLEIASPDDYIWVQDYQLMLVPQLLRKANPALKIAYFHHIPFPSSELFRILQKRTEILQGLLGADVIGFHTYDYMRHFLTTVKRVLGCHTHLDEIHYQGRNIKLLVQPLGVDVKMIRQHGDAEPTPEIKQLAQSLGRQKILLSIDRLDYTKGIPERLKAFRQLLSKYPEYIGKVTLIQVAVPSRSDIPSYSELKLVVEQLIGQINGEFSAPGYTPVQYLYRAFTQEEIIAFYRLADVAVVTPLRDGLNLVCKEYVAARDDTDGVLILSEMAGAAAEMSEALLINPYDVTGFVGALRQALTMDVSERCQRMHKLRQQVLSFDNVVWARTFIQNWYAAVARNANRSIVVNENQYDNVLDQISDAEKCFIFIDFDSAAIIAEKFLNVIKRIPNCQITLITQQESDYCQKYFANLAINYIAESGNLIYLHAINKYWHLSPQFFSTVEADILRLLNNYTQQISGSYVLRNSFALVLDYKAADSLSAAAKAQDLLVSLAQLLENTAFGVYNEKNCIEIRSVVADRSYAMISVLENLDYQPNNLLITIGDEQICEDLQNSITQKYHRTYSPISYHFNSIMDTEKLAEKIHTKFSPLLADL